MTYSIATTTAVGVVGVGVDTPACAKLLRGGASWRVRGADAEGTELSSRTLCCVSTPIPHPKPPHPELGISTYSVATAATVGFVGVGVGAHVCTQLYVGRRHRHRRTALEARP